MTLSELRTMVRSLISYDLEGSAATDADLNTLINRAYQQQVAQAGPSTMTQASVLANQKEIVVAGLIRLDQMWWQTGSQAPLELLPLPPDWEWRKSLTDTGTPRFYWLDGNRLMLYPTPDTAGTLLMLAVVAPTPLTQDNHEPITPSHLHPAIAYRAAAEWALRYNHQKAQAFLAVSAEIEHVGRRERFASALHALDGVPR